MRSSSKESDKTSENKRRKIKELEEQAKESELESEELWLRRSFLQLEGAAIYCVGPALQ